MYAKNREDWNKVKLFNETKRCEKITCVRRVDIKAHEKKIQKIANFFRPLIHETSHRDTLSQQGQMKRAGLNAAVR